MDYKRRLEELIREKALKVADEPIFKLSSGKMSNYYIDLRIVTLDPEGGYVIGNVVYDLIKDRDVDAVGGLTLGADPISYATSIVSFLNKNPIKPFVVRKEPKGHGTGKQIEGNVKPGERVYILEDVITTAGSSLKAFRVAKDFGLNVLGIIALVDRQEGGEENIKREGLELISIFKVSDLLKR